MADKIILLKDQMHIGTLEIFSRMEKLNHFRSLHLSHRSFDPARRSHALDLFIMNQVFWEPVRFQ